MFLKKLALTYYKNHKAGNFNFDSPITAIIGNNGVGKTNLLDAIYYLAISKSYFQLKDNLISTIGEKGFRIQGEILLDEQVNKIVIQYSEDNKKIITSEDEKIKVFEHVGKYPIVFIGPEDIEIINGSSSNRRKFLNQLLCQTDSEYLKQSIKYNKVLLNRNALLKNWKSLPNHDLLTIYNEQLIESGVYIYSSRKKLIDFITPFISKWLNLISNQNEHLTIRYLSNLTETSFRSLLEESLQKDILTTRTNIGIHRDDLSFSFQEHFYFKEHGSQGQKKSLLLALKFSESDYFFEMKKTLPIILFDDITAKMDESRIENILIDIISQRENQFFITDTTKDKIKDLSQKKPSSLNFIEL